MESCCCRTYSKQSDNRFRNPKMKLTTEIFFSLTWSSCLTSPRKLLLWKSKWSRFYSMVLKWSKKTYSVVSTTIPAFQSHREQPLKLYYCCPCLIPEVDVVTPLFICCNCSLRAPTPVRWDCPTGKFSQVWSSVMPSIQQGKSCHRWKSLPKINSTRFFLSVRYESSF